MSVQVDQRHWSPSVVTSSSQDAPGQGVVASDTNHLLRGVPELLGVQVALVHGHHDVEGVGNSITFKSFLQLCSKIYDRSTCVVDLHLVVGPVMVGRVVEGHQLRSLSDCLGSKPGSHPEGCGGIIWGAKEHTVSYKKI